MTCVMQCLHVKSQIQAFFSYRSAQLSHRLIQFYVTVKDENYEFYTIYLCNGADIRDDAI